MTEHHRQGGVFSVLYTGFEKITQFLLTVRGIGSLAEVHLHTVDAWASGAVRGLQAAWQGPFLERLLPGCNCQQGPKGQKRI